MSKSMKPMPKFSKVPPGLSRNCNPEKVVTRNLLNGFVAKGSRGEQIIEEILGCTINKVSLNALITIGELLSDLTKVKLERNYKRKKDLIVKWFNDNEQRISYYKPYVKIIYTTNRTQNKKK